MTGSEPKPIYDVLVVGAGPVGLTLSLALSRFLPGVSLGLLDRAPLSVPKDARASAIAAGVRQVFEAIGVWGAMEKDANPIRRMKITDSGHGELTRPLLLSFEGPLDPKRPFAHMVPNTASARALLAASAGAFDVLDPGSVTALAVQPAHAEVTLDDGRVIGARLVIAADGGHSTLRQLAGIGTFAQDYRQSGIVTTIAHEVPHDDVAYEHFRPAGPFASLPLKGNFSSLVWTETPEMAKAVLAMGQDEVARSIETAMGGVLGAVEIVDRIQSFPLGLKLAHRFISSRVALVGDAAHVIHPIAGQGLNLGLKDVAVLAEVVVDAARLGEDIGAGAVLSRYEQRRRADTALMAMATDGLNRLFSNDSGALRAARDTGLAVVDRLAPLKSAFIDRAAGANGAKLLRGMPL